MKADLKSMLRAKGIKQKDIASLVGRCEAEISCFVRGTKQMPEDVQNKIAELLNRPIEEIEKVIPSGIKVDKRGHSARVYAHEVREGLLGVNSEANSLYYLLDKKRDVRSRRLTILAILESEEMSIKLNLNMAKALIEELKDICEMQWGYYI